MRPGIGSYKGFYQYEIYSKNHKKKPSFCFLTRFFSLIYMSMKQIVDFYPVKP